MHKKMNFKNLKNTHTIPIFMIIINLLIPPPATSGTGTGTATCTCTCDGGDAAAPPLPPPPPLIFADQRLAAVYPIIQNFKKTITSDPFNITATWVGSNISNYRGFYLESPPDNKSAIAVASIDFNGFQLTAPTLEGFLDQLPDIALFHANSNNFAGTIPPKIADLPYLFELDISNNKFSGPFPTAVLSMNALTFLDIRFNSFSGSVPAELFSKELNVLFINNNDFVTRLPENIGGKSLIYLTLANNKILGPIPRSFFRALAMNLTEILLLNNELSGCLPYEVGFLEKAVVFDAGGNRLTGPLPFSLGCLENLEILNFAGNLLYGHVPEVLCELPNLANLSLSGNFFTGFGPGCWKLIKNGVLDLKNNCVRGLKFQRPFHECFDFFAYPRYCPYTPTYGHIPCWSPHSRASSASGISHHELAPLHS